MKSRINLITILLIVMLAVVACSEATDESNETTLNTEQQSAREITDDDGQVDDVVSEEELEAFDGDFESSEDMAEAEPMMDMAAGSGAVGGALPPANQALSIAATAPASRAASPTNTLPEEPADMTFDNPGTNPFLDTQDDNLSTFALDVDSASFTVARNYLLTRDQYPPADAIRVEEFVNYFNAGYDSPMGDDAFAIYLDAAPAPFGFDEHYLMRVGIQGRYIAPEDRDPVFLVFVIDVSGSMDMENRLGLVKESLALLLDGLREDDRVGIVVYSDNSRAVLDPTPASDRRVIDAAINSLRPEGSTNVQAGLDIGYQMAADNMREGENTRVVVLSDGVANTGATAAEDILETVAENAEQGITMSTIGFGMGNFNDALMEQLANDGDGNYYYVDEIGEARRVFVHNLTGTLQVIGYDAKIQVEFNPDVADRYRLLGYENRAIADEDFRNDTVDAGEVGAGQSATALYELALEELDADEAQRVSNDVIATVYVRYEDAETREIVEISQDLTIGDLLDEMGSAPQSFALHAAAAEFAEILRESFWAEDATYGDVMRVLADAGLDDSDDEQVMGFVAMVEAAMRYSDR